MELKKEANINARVSEQVWEEFKKSLPDGYTPSLAIRILMKACISGKIQLPALQATISPQPD